MTKIIPHSANGSNWLIVEVESDANDPYLTGPGRKTGHRKPPPIHSRGERRKKIIKMPIPAKRVYIFHRAEGWYPVELRNDADARKNAEGNPGTVKVTDALSEKVIWEKTT